MEAVGLILGVLSWVFLDIARIIGTSNGVDSDPIAATIGVNAPG